MHSGGPEPGAFLEIATFQVRPAPSWIVACHAPGVFVGVQCTCVCFISVSRTRCMGSLSQGGCDIVTATAACLSLRLACIATAHIAAATSLPLHTIRARRAALLLPRHPAAPQPPGRAPPGTTSRARPPAVSSAAPPCRAAPVSCHPVCFATPPPGVARQGNRHRPCNPHQAHQPCQLTPEALCPLSAAHELAVALRSLHNARSGSNMRRHRRRWDDHRGNSRPDFRALAGSPGSVAFLRSWRPPQS